jgi:polysaccharide biosynthesis transport protein
MPPPGGGSAEEQNARLLQMLRRGKWIILILPLLAGAATWAYYESKIPGCPVTRLYRASAVLQLDVVSHDLIKGTTPSESRPNNLARQQEGIFKSQNVIGPLSENPEVAALGIFRNLGSKPLAAALFDGLGARADPRTDRVTVSFTSESREDAVVVTDGAVEAFLGYYQKRARDRAVESAATLEGLRDTRAAEMEELDREIHTRKLEHKVTFDDLRNPIAGKLEDHGQSSQDAWVELTHAQIELETIEKKAEETETFLDYGRALRASQPSAILEETIDTYSRTIQDLNYRYARDEKVFPAGSSQLQEIERERAFLQEQVNEIYLQYSEQGLSSARDEVLRLKTTYERLQSQVEEIEAEFFALENVLAGLRILQGDRTRMQGDVNTYANRISDLVASGESGGLNIHIIDPARAGVAPVYPETQKMLIMAVAAGFLLGLGLVLLRGFIDRRIWTVEEVPNLIGTSVVGVFPQLFSHKRAQVGRIVEEDPASLAAESIRSLRTSCSFGLPDNGRGVVLITSANSGEGKSVIASNLAIAIAQSGRKTLLIDADLRSPGQNEIFAVIGKRGLGNVLAGDGDVESGIMQRVTSEGLDLLPAGDASLGAAELIEGDACRQLIGELREEYDVIVIDSSPVLETAETRVLASLVDVNVLVMRMNVSTAPAGQRAAGILRSVGAELLGVMLNGVRRNRGAKAYAAGLTYGYGYGYGYGQYRAGDKPTTTMQEVASQAPPASSSEPIRFPLVGDIQTGS